MPKTAYISRLKQLRHGKECFRRFCLANWFTLHMSMNVPGLYKISFCLTSPTRTSKISSQIVITANKPTPNYMLGAALPCWRLHPGFIWQVSLPSTWTHASFRGPVPVLVTGVSLLPAPPDLEQLTAGSATARHWAWRIPSISEDISVSLWTAETAAR